MAELLDTSTIEVERGRGAKARMLSESARIEALAAVLRASGREGLAEVRRTLKPHFPSTLQRMLDNFVLGHDLPLEDDQDALAAALHVERWSTGAFARANLSGERVRPSREEIEGRIRIFNIIRPIDALLERGFIGRAAALETLRAFRRRPSHGGGLRSSPAFLLYGVGGMGKSTLVARFVKEVSEEAKGTSQPSPLWAYLDFDRSTLQPRQATPAEPAPPGTRPRLVLEDVIRQITAQRPDARGLVEQHAQMIQQSTYAGGLESFNPGDDYRSAAVGIAERLRALLKDEVLVVVLDTFEEVERAGPDASFELFELFDVIASVLPSLRLVVSGRGPAPIFRSTPENELRIGELEEHEAHALLEHVIRAEGEDAAIDGEAAKAVWELVGRSPLSLQLAGRVIAAEGVGSISDAATRADTLGRIRDELVRGFLYHRIVNHIAPADVTLRDVLRQVARAGLVLRRVTLPAIERILLPAIGVAASPKDLARRVFDALALETGLVRTLDPETLGVREELRGPALSALKLDDNALVWRVHKKAAAFYAEIGDAGESILHRLAIGEPLAGLAGELSDPLISELRDLVDELPSETARALRELRPSAPEVDSAREQLEWERKVATAADVALKQGDVRAARQALAERNERGATTELHRIEMRICEAEGDLAAAVAAARRDLEASRTAEHPVRFAGAGVYLAKLLEWRGDRAEALEILIEVEASEILAGEHRLRLELVLARLGAAERMSLETEERRWDWGLQARQLLGRVDPSSRSEPTVVRLLAGTLGRDEPSYLREAVSRIGLDPQAPPERVASLAAALLAWSRQLEQGSAPRSVLARAIKLPETAAHDAGAWRSHVSGLGTSAASVLGEDFWRLGPPAGVLSALRQYYLHWGYGRPALFGPRPGAQHFLDALPLDYTRRELRELESYIVSVYSRADDLQRLASLAGADASSIDWSAAPTMVARSLLNDFGPRGSTTDLVRTLLNDVPSPELAARLRQIIGAEWLARQGLGGGIMTELDVTMVAGAAGLTAKPLPVFLADAGTLTDADRRLLIDQALVLMEQLYVHLPLKRAMYATDPVQRLKLLRHRLPGERAFHEEMIAIFTSVRDLHTNYILPLPYRNATAVLPFQIGEYFEGQTRRYIVFSTTGNDTSFRPGVPVTHWNGVPIERAVELNARLHAGGNDAAKHARGLQRMTVRPLMMSLPPDEAWVDVRYLDTSGKAQERRFEWQAVVQQDGGGAPEASGRAIDDAMLGHLTVLGVDAENEVANQVIEAVFNPRQVRIDDDVRRFLESQGGGLESAGGPDFMSVSTMPSVFRFGRVQTPSGELGRIQIRTFNVPSPDAFVAELIRILALLPQDRLILDVRGNGGGNIIAGEKSLQLFTDAEIEPERFHFINSPLVLRMAEATPAWFDRWVPSLRRAVLTGSVYSQGLPFLDQAEYNHIGRKYPGKVVLLTDAFCYSTTDIFTAGFRDHRIGPILGTMANTGAGGANVFAWDLVEHLCRTLPGQPIATPPGGATFRVAIRRSTRVGDNAGEPLEDLGVEPDEVHRTTLRDLLEDDADLFARAAHLIST